MVWRAGRHKSNGAEDAARLQMEDPLTPAGKVWAWTTGMALLHSAHGQPLIVEAGLLLARERWWCCRSCRVRASGLHPRPSPAHHSLQVLTTADMQMPSLLAMLDSTLAPTADTARDWADATASCRLAARCAVSLGREGRGVAWLERRRAIQAHANRPRGSHTLVNIPGIALRQRRGPGREAHTTAGQRPRAGPCWDTRTALVDSSGVRGRG